MRVAGTDTTAEGERVQRADARRNREKVLAAARARFAEHGLEAQIDDIARAAGVGVGTVYRHFQTKEDLLEALADARFEGLADAARAALDDPDPGNGFRAFMRDSARIMAEDRALSEAMGQRPAVCARAAERADLLALIREVVSRAQAAGSLRPEVVAEDMPGLLCGIGAATQAKEGRPTIGWERYVEIVLAGLSAQDGPPLPGPLPSTPGA